MQRIFALLTLLLNPSSELEPPDLCAEVYLDAAGDPVTDDRGVSVSRYCEPTGPKAPVWGEEVCCEFGEGDDVKCTATDAREGCDSRLTLWCEYGERVGDEVVCYQPFDDACDAGLCQLDYQPGPQEGGELLCCNGPCVPFDPFNPFCEGDLYYCWAPFQHQSGVVECYGGEPFHN